VCHKKIKGNRENPNSSNMMLGTNQRKREFDGYRRFKKDMPNSLANASTEGRKDEILELRPVCPASLERGKKISVATGGCWESLWGAGRLSPEKQYRLAAKGFDSRAGRLKT